MLSYPYCETTCKQDVINCYHAFVKWSQQSQDRLKDQLDKTYEDSIHKPSYPTCDQIGNKPGSGKFKSLPFFIFRNVAGLFGRSFSTFCLKILQLSKLFWCCTRKQLHILTIENLASALPLNMPYVAKALSTGCNWPLQPWKISDFLKQVRSNWFLKQSLRKSTRFIFT